MMAPALNAGRWIRWYLKQISGEAKWDEYLEQASNEDVVPMSRRDFERHRSEHKESNPQVRCC
jgi:uncharacterized short protein YbdD (DUF466 family)